MKTKFFQTILIVSLVFTYGHICSQNNTTTDFYNQIKNYDLSTIFNPDSILIEDRENNSEKIKRADNWGDYRIPDCGDLDEGAGEFAYYPN